MPARTVAGLARPHEGRIVGGVAAGIAARLGLDANVVRLAFAVLTLAGGLGVVAYLVGWAVLPATDASPPDAAGGDPDAVQALALGLVVLGGLLLGRTLGLWFGDPLVWPLALAASGIALLWVRPVPDDEQREAADWPILERLPPAAAEAVAAVLGARRGALARVVAGSALVGGGIVLFAVSVDSWDALRGGLLAAVVVLAGLTVALGPGLARLARALAQERRERIRSEERADVAAHLHDSVLQTLALVQRRAGDPREVVRLARRQERELRQWLLTGGRPGATDGSASLGRALDAVAAEVEETHGVPVEVVRVRDCALGGLDPLVAATREAIVNAARHSGASLVSVYVEVEPERVTVFVRDRGRGFDPGLVPGDRRGIAASIVGRMRRHGGDAIVRSAPGDGAEVELVAPRVASGDRAPAGEGP